MQMMFSVLTRFGFMALSIDDDFMNTCYKPWCLSLLQQDIASEIHDSNRIRLLRASLIEFALLGCLEAQQLMSKLNCQFGADDDYIESIVNARCSNLKRFLNAHEGAGRGVNEGDEVSSYEQALKEVKAGERSRIGYGTYFLKWQELRVHIVVQPCSTASTEDWRLFSI